MCLSGRYITYGDAYLFSIDHILCISPSNSVVTCPILHILNAVTIASHMVIANAHALTHNYSIQRCHMEWHMCLFSFPALHLASTKA